MTHWLWHGSALDDSVWVGIAFSVSATWKGLPHGQRIPAVRGNFLAAARSGDHGAKLGHRAGAGRVAAGDRIAPDFPPGAHMDVATDRLDGTVDAALKHGTAGVAVQIEVAGPDRDTARLDGAGREGDCRKQQG